MFYYRNIVNFIINLFILIKGYFLLKYKDYLGKT